MGEGTTVLLAGVAAGTAADCRAALDGEPEVDAVRTASGAPEATAPAPDVDVIVVGPDREGDGGALPPERRVDGGAPPAVLRLVPDAGPEGAAGATRGAPDATLATPIEPSRLRSVVRRLGARRAYEALVNAQYDALREQALLRARRSPGEAADGPAYGTLTAEIETLQERREHLEERLDHEDYRALFARLGGCGPPDGLDA